MVKVVSIIFLFVLNSSAAYFYADRNLCVDDYYYTQSDRTLHFKRSNSSSYQTTTNKNQTFLSGYEYNSTTGICAPKQILRDLQISNHDYHFLIALIAVLSGFIFLFFSIYIAVEVAKK